MDPFRSKAAKTIMWWCEKAVGKPHVWILLRHKSFTRASSISALYKRKNIAIATMLLPLEMSNTSFSSYEELRVAEHQHVHAANTTVAHQYHLFVWQLIARCCPVWNSSWKGCLQVATRSAWLYLRLSVQQLGADARHGSAAAAEITQVKLVAGNKGLPQNSFRSSFPGAWLPWQTNWEAEKLGWQHRRPLPQAKQNEFPSFPSQCNL